MLTVVWSMKAGIKGGRKMIRRWVKDINRARETIHKNVVMWECNLSIIGMKESVDVLLKDSEYDMIRERGFYLC